MKDGNFLLKNFLRTAWVESFFLIKKMKEIFWIFIKMIQTEFSSNFWRMFFFQVKISLPLFQNFFGHFQNFSQKNNPKIFLSSKIKKNYFHSFLKLNKKNHLNFFLSKNFPAKKSAMLISSSKKLFYKSLRSPPNPSSIFWGKFLIIGIQISLYFPRKTL